MKNITKALLFFCMLLLTQTGCDKGFAELNENPLAPTEAQDGAIFNSIVQSLQLGWNRQLFLHNEKLYDITELAVVTAETFGNPESGAEDVWTNYYKALKNARELERRFAAHTEDPNIPNVVHAQLKVLMAYKTFQITDFFGDIPYSEAGRIFEEESIIRAKYDTHEEIYKSLIDDLIWASEILTTSGGQTEAGNSYLSYGAFDTFLGDNKSRWAQFSNSLLLRYLVRIYDKEPDYVAPRIQTMIENGASFLGEGGDIVMSPKEQDWLNQGVNWSFREHNKVRMGTTIWNYMTDEEGEVIDPRALIFFEPNNDGEWTPFPQIPSENTPQSGGNPYSNARDGQYENKGSGNIYASVNYYLIRDEIDIPEIIMTSAEVKFLLSEVFLRGIGVQADAANAGFNYQLGMLESLEFWQNIMVNSSIWQNQSPVLSIAELFAVTSHPKYDISMINDEDEKLKRIYAQRWVDAFRQPWEAFSLLRQTNNLPREKAENTYYRFQYPPSENAFNTENYNAQVGRMGGDENNVKIWWMD
jgi:hypothetical protein